MPPEPKPPRPINRRRRHHLLPAEPLLRMHMLRMHRHRRRNLIRHHPPPTRSSSSKHPPVVVTPKLIPPHGPSASRRPCQGREYGRPVEPRRRRRQRVPPSPKRGGTQPVVHDGAEDRARVGRRRRQPPDGEHVVREEARHGGEVVLLGGVPRVSGDGAAGAAVAVVFVGEGDRAEGQCVCGGGRRGGGRGVGGFGALLPAAARGVGGPGFGVAARGKDLVDVAGDEGEEGVGGEGGGGGEEGAQGGEGGGEVEVGVDFFEFDGGDEFCVGVSWGVGWDGGRAWGYLGAECRGLRRGGRGSSRECPRCRPLSWRAGR